MRTDQIVTILRREYMTRVKSKGFWVGTLLLPMAMALLIIVPSLVLSRTHTRHVLTVVDGVGGVGARLKADLEEEPRPEPASTSEQLMEQTEQPEQADISQFEISVVAAEGDEERQREALDQAVLAGEMDSWIWISAATLDSSEVEYHAESVSNFLTQRRIERALTRVFSEVRLEGAGYDPGSVVQLTRGVDLETLKVTEEGSKAETGEAGFIVAYFLFFLLYMVVAIYGGLVMNGVLEEKTSRIVEVLLATTTPKEMLFGKLIGISLAGLTQLGVWALAIGVLTAPGIASAFALGFADSIPQIAPSVLIHFLFHFLLGFFLFASFYAAIGSATNSVQEAQPLTGIVVPFLIAPMLFMMPVINDPDSTLAVTLSLIPVFTPLLMLLRIVVKTPPVWQIALGYLLTTATVLTVMAASARIYRIGILMHGKRPTVAELGRWIRRA